MKWLDPSFLEDFIWAQSLRPSSYSSFIYASDNWQQQRYITKRHIRKKIHHKRYITKRHIRKKIHHKKTSEKDTSQKIHQKKIHHITATYSRIALQKDMANKNVQSKYVQRSLTVYIQIEGALAEGRRLWGADKRGGTNLPRRSCKSCSEHWHIYTYMYTCI